MKYTSLLLICWILLAACGGQPTHPSDGAANGGNKPAAPNTEIITFTNAAVYATSTGCVFSKENGKKVTGRVSALPEKATVTVPSDFLENGGLHGFGCELRHGGENSFY
ncbi:MAG: hypothetical protein EPO28_03145 [Saprospiraceae bacterium]|nr:MAG: hypothetical protein EPO28_03145 [Saprospiraceae bacterium]